MLDRPCLNRSLCAIHDFSTDHGDQRFDGANFILPDAQVVAVEHKQVRELARLQAAQVRKALWRIAELHARPT